MGEHYSENAQSKSARLLVRRASREHGFSRRLFGLLGNITQRMRSHRVRDSSFGVHLGNVASAEGYSGCEGTSHRECIVPECETLRSSVHLGNMASAEDYSGCEGTSHRECVVPECETPRSA